VAAGNPGDGYGQRSNSNKEAKKPKGDKPKSGGSAYKLSQGAPGGPASSPFAKKK